MRKVKVKKTVRRLHRRKVIASPVSLPPSVSSLTTVAPVATPVPTPPVAASGPKEPDKDYWKKDKVVNAHQYEQAQKILALKAVGMDAAAIAESLGLSKQTIHNLTFIAGKNGWMTEFANAREQIEYRIMPKVLRELEAGLDDQTRHVTSGQKVSQQIALEVAGGTVFKSFEQTGAATPTTNIIGIKIQMVPGIATEMREGSGGGVAAYEEGETVDVGLDDERS